MMLVRPISDSWVSCSAVLERVCTKSTLGVCNLVCKIRLYSSLHKTYNIQCFTARNSVCFWSVKLHLCAMWLRGTQV